MTPNPYFLRKGARQIDFEISSVLALFRRFEVGQLPSDPLEGQALLEAWLLHLRGLLEFFYPTPRTRNDTLRAEWYVADAMIWRQVLPKLRKRERKRWQALHKHLAHISYLRDGRVARWRAADQHIMVRRLHLFRDHLGIRRRAWFPALKWL